MGIDSGLSSTDLIWVLLGAALVFFMQAGFMVVEVGLTRAKNTGNIIMKNLFDFALGTLFYFVLGFGLMHGEDVAGIIGIPTADWLSGNMDMTALIFQTVFCATAATIVSGSMAERTKFPAYCIYSVIISMIVYPISGHWIWGGGWLAQLGFHDFAGSTAVHMVGGISAFLGALFLGPRIGKYDKDGNAKAIPGHNLTFAALGVFILWFCWFGFNGASTYGIDGQGTVASLVYVTTNIAPAAAATTCLAITWIKYKKPDVSMCLNGALAGLVAITAGTDMVSPVAAILIGVIAGFVVIYGCEFIEKKLKVDDPVGAVAVHGLCGAVGTILVGVFSFSNGLWGAAAGTISWAEAFSFLGIQVLGVLSVALWVTVTMGLVFYVIKKTIGLRVSAEEEIGGLDYYEHGLESAYAGFEMEHSALDSIKTEEFVAPASFKTVTETASTSPKLTKVTIIAQKSKFEILKAALNKIGVTGMTVTEVMGCGTQKGQLYRGSPVDIALIPKVKVDVVVSAVPVQVVVDTAKLVLNSGHIGDGKIFVYDVENVIKIRTGEEGYDALQDSPAN
ncbi:MAG: ammonium transporter [Christensenellales bacterium]